MAQLKYVDQRSLISEEELTQTLNDSLSILHLAQQGEEIYSDSLGWLDTRKWAGDAMLTEIESIAAKIRCECDAFVLIGVGGSNNAARSVIEALADGAGPEIIYAGNTLSPNALNRVLKRLQGKTYAIDCIAKNFETLEPGSSFRILREDMNRRWDAKTVASRTVCTGTYGSTLEALCKAEGYTFVPFATDIGGRFSAVSHVGLLPMAVAGIDIRALVKGAADMAAELHAAKGTDNLALRYAVMRNLYHRKGYSVEILSCFEPQMHWFFKWWAQLFAESEGKDNTGLFPVACEFSEDLHAVGQFIQDGSPIMFETFLEFSSRCDSLIIHDDGKKDYFGYLNDQDFYDINQSALEATVTAHSTKLPCLRLSFDRIDAYNFGQIFYFFEFAVYLSGRILGINPFDQPGVEAYKGWMFKALGK